jgi:hypothetical protein
VPACPCHRRSWSPSGSRSLPRCPTAKTSIRSAVTGPASLTASCSTSSSRSWCSAAATAGSPTPPARRHPAPPRCVDPRRGRAAAPGRAGRLRPAVRPGAGAPGGGQPCHQGALWWPGRRPQPGRPAQAGAETVGGGRGRWHPAGRAGRPGQLPRRRATGGNVGHSYRGWPLPERPMGHLDAGSDDQPCRQVLAERGMVGQIATRGLSAPIQASRCWVIEPTHAWGNQYGKLRWCTERRRTVVAFCWRWPAPPSSVAGWSAGSGPPPAGRPPSPSPVTPPRAAS